MLPCVGDSYVVVACDGEALSFAMSCITDSVVFDMLSPEDGGEGSAANLW